MKRTYVLTALTTALALALVLSGCPSAGSGGGGGDTPVSVDSVAPATPGGTAVTDSFADGAGFSSPLPADKTEAFLTAAQGIASVSGFIGEFLSEKADADWPPSGDLTIDPDPENFDTATRISISASFGDPDAEGIYLDANDEPGGLDALDFYGEGAVAGSAEVTATRQASSHGLDYPKRITFTAETSAEFVSRDLAEDDDDAIDPIVPQDSDTPLPTVPASELYVAVNWNLDAKPAYRSTIDGPELSGVEAAYAVSAGLSAALTVVDAHIDDTDGDGKITGSDTAVVSGNFLVDFTFNDEEKLNISDSMTEAELEDYLEGKLAGDFTLTIGVYDAGGSLDANYSYSITDIVNILQSVQ